MSFSLSHNDFLLLEKYRLDRFCTLFEEILSDCWLSLDHSNILNIYCAEPWLVDWILADIEQLATAAWLTTGAEQLSIYYAREEIYSVATRSFMPQSRSSSDFSVAS